MKAQRPKYFIEHNKNWNHGAVSGMDIARSAIGYAFAGFSFGDVYVANNSIGPENVPGCLLAPSGSDEIPKDYKISDDAWFEIFPASKPGIEARCWFGYPKDAPKPGPEQLLRPDVPTGTNGIIHPLKAWVLEYYERFGDNNVWEIPCARRFDFEKSDFEFVRDGNENRLAEILSSKTMTVEDISTECGKTMAGVFKPNMQSSLVRIGGKWEYGSPTQQYRELFEFALKIDRFLEDRLTVEEKEMFPSLTSDSVRDVAVRILQTFYNIGPDEAGWLEILTDESVLYILRRFCDYESLDNWRQKKIYETYGRISKEEALKETMPSDSGSTEETNDTLQPSGS